MLPGVGVVGSGPLVRFLVPLLRDKGFPVSGIWGIHQTQVDSVAQELQIPFSTDSIDTLLLRREVQLIVVACPPHLHSAIVTKSFNVGKHVLCDWTAALTTAEMRDMVERATYYPALISILCHPLRFLVSCQRMRALIAASSFLGQVHLIEANIVGEQLTKLGNLYSVNCDHYMGGGILPTVASHIIDLISFVTNTRAKRVNGLLRRLNQDYADPKYTLNRVTTSDYCTFQMELEARDVRGVGRKPLLLATATINSRAPNTYVHEIRVHGSGGLLLLKEGSLYGKRYEEPGTGELDGELELISSEAVDPRLKLNDMLPSPYDQGLNKLISTLSNAFREEESDFCTKAVPADSLDHSTSGTDSSYSSATSSLTSTDMNNKTDSEKMNHWFKEAVSLAANFEDGQYIQAVIESLKESSERREWVRVKYNTPFSVMSPSKLNASHRL